MARAARRGNTGRPGRAAWRLALCAGAGSVVLVVVLLAGASWSIAVSSGWDGAASMFLCWTWRTILDQNPTETAALSRKEDSSRAAADTALLSACVASLIAVAFVLVEAGREHGAHKGLLIGFAVASVALAWLSIHTLFTLRYARLFYASDPPAGIDFHADDQPDYRDFAYAALTIGMTFQVSDTDVTTKPIRRTAIRHALISFLFGAVIVAIMINVVGALLK